MRAVKERMNLYITKSIMDDLRHAIPAVNVPLRGGGLARELRRRKLRAALAASAGAWKDEDHPN